ncbi:LysR family transcriptional regulator [Amycolatopsis jejuensis]|uniref:LysR family transcriptional regulator n=1 Tax=Amycolatopsis jejuensis TaxID=330084 RepID=UPI001FE00B96|nr:LysR family transcriptional regulator [Amycolatopsis jejuensis]
MTEYPVVEWSSVQLRSFVELRRRGTISAVAEALGYTAGGVSQQLTALERAAGTALTRRVGRRVELTDAGLTLAEHAQRILDIEAEAAAALERDDIAGQLRVAMFATAAADILPLMLTRVEQQYPRLTVRSQEMDVDEVHDAVASGAVDLAVGLDYPDVPIRRDPALHLIRLYRERFSLAVPAGSLPGARRISLRDTASLGWILPPEASYYGLAIRTVCRRAGVEPQLRHEVTDTAASLALVEAGVGIGPVTDLMLRLRPSRFDVLALTEVFERHIVAVVRSAARNRPSVAALVGVLRGLAEET